MATTAANAGATAEPRGRDVFVSYSTNDKPVADAIVHGLEEAGIRCWVAPRDVTPGMLFGEAIVSAISRVPVMVVVISSESNGSTHVVREVGAAVANNATVVPFRVDSTELTGAMSYYLSTEHWLDAVTPPLESHIAQLVTVVSGLLANAPARSGAEGTVDAAAGVSAGAAAAAAAAPAATAAAASAEPATSPRPRPRPRPALIWAIVAGVVLLAGVAVTVLLLVRPFGPSDPATPGGTAAPAVTGRPSGGATAAPGGAVPIAAGVSITPAEGWSVVAEDEGWVLLFSDEPGEYAVMDVQVGEAWSGDVRETFDFDVEIYLGAREGVAELDEAGAPAAWAGENFDQFVSAGFRCTSTTGDCIAPTRGTFVELLNTTTGNRAFVVYSAPGSDVLENHRAGFEAMLESLG